MMKRMDFGTNASCCFSPSYHTEPQSLCNFKTLGALTVPVNGTVSAFCVVCYVYTITVCSAISRNIVLRE